MPIVTLESDNTSTMRKPNIGHIAVKDRTVVVTLEEYINDVATRQNIVQKKEFVFPKGEVKKLLQDLYME